MAARVLVSLEDVEVRYGGKPVFSGIDLHVAEDDKICLIGRNGAGKTTLMKLITGELSADEGKRFAFPGAKIGYLPQFVAFNPKNSVREFVLTGLPKADETVAHRADIVLEPLTLDAEALMGNLSGGQQRRAALARALVAEPDLLLLDEPTNHLDLAAIEWLERYMNAYRGALICVSHDRAFLSAVSRKVFWLEQGSLRVCPKGYEGFEDWAEQILLQDARALQNMQKKFEAEVDWTQGGVTGRRKRNQRRLRELYRLRDKIRVDKAAYRNKTRKIELDALAETPSSKIVAEFKQVSKTFRQDEKVIPILQDFSYRIIRGDKIGILGKNGSGKSTFLKLLTGALEPDDGRIFRSKKTELAYFDQNRSGLDPKKTLWRTLCPEGDYVMLGAGEEKKQRHVCAYLKDFLFDPKAAHDVVGTLSGGQQNRLMLAKTLINPGNLLILDEPTNDLDMDTLDMLQEMLSDYPGTLILVSHDRDFLDRTATEVLAFEGDAVVESHVGGYSDYLAFKTRQKMPAPKPVVEKMAPVVELPKKAAVKLSFKYLHELKTLPDTIRLLEEEIMRLREELADSSLYMQDPERFDKASRRFPRAQAELEAAELRWLELDAMRDAAE